MVTPPHLRQQPFWESHSWFWIDTSDLCTWTPKVALIGMSCALRLQAYKSAEIVRNSVMYDINYKGL